MVTDRRAEATWNDNRAMWVIRVQRDGVRKAFYSAVQGRKGKREVEAKADKWLSIGTAEMRFSEAWAQYTKYVSHTAGTGHTQNTEGHGKHHLLPSLRLKKLSSITRGDWQECINEMAAAGKSARTCKNVISTISAFINYCVGERWTVNQIEKPLTVPSAARRPEEKHVLQPPALKTLFSDPTMLYKGEPQEAFYIHAWRFYVVTGLRRGELAGLRREDVGDLLTVRRNVNKYHEETQGKTENAQRSMKLSGIAADILAQQRIMLDRMGIVSDWVFPDRYGGRSDPNLIGRQWARYCAYHNIKCTVHELRHTFISINKISTPEVLLKSLVGHSVSMDTIGVYGHEIDGEKELAAQYVDAAFASVLDKTQN